MNAFKLRRFNALVILQCVRWYGKYAISVCLEHTNSDGGVELCER
jgi:transposase-like protein